MNSLLARVEQLLDGDIAALKAWFTGTALPALKTFFHNTIEEEIASLLPILEAAIPVVIADVAAINNPLGWGAAVVSVIEHIAPQIEAAGLKVANESLHTAVGAALSTLAATAGISTTPPV